MPGLYTFQKALEHMKRGGYALASPNGYENTLFFWSKRENGLCCFKPVGNIPTTDFYDLADMNDVALSATGWLLLRRDPWADCGFDVIEKLTALNWSDRSAAEKVLDDWIATRQNWRHSLRELGDVNCSETVVDGPAVLGSLILNVGNVVLNQVEANLGNIERFVKENKLGTLVHSCMWSVPAQKSALFKVGEALIEEKKNKQ